MERADTRSSRSLGDRAHRLAFSALATTPRLLQPARRAVVDGFYRGNADPWRYSSNAWEARRHDALLRACPSRDGQWALDVGCGTGHLTRALLRDDLAQWVVGIDISARAVRRAAHHNLGLAQGFRAQFLQLDLVDDGRYWFAERFGLVVCADVLYYLPRTNVLSEIVNRLISWTSPGGSLVLAHPASQATYLHDAACSNSSLRRTDSVHVAGEEGAYRIDVFTRATSGAVAHSTDGSVSTLHA